MRAYRTPGLYFEPLDTRRPPILPLRTDVAGFVGIAERGPLHEPVKVESWMQFSSTFGHHIPQGYLAYGVEGFFANGGHTCWVVRAADPDLARAESFPLYGVDGNPVLLLEASSPGVWGGNIGVTVLNSAVRFSLAVWRLGWEDETEYWLDLSMDPGDARFVGRVLNDARAGSRLVLFGRLCGSKDTRPGPPALRQPGLLAAQLRMAPYAPPDALPGRDGLSTLRVEHLAGDEADEQRAWGWTRLAKDQRRQVWGLARLAEVDEIGIIALPDIMDKPRVEPRPVEPGPLDCAVLDNPQPKPSPVDVSREYPPALNDTDMARLQRALVRQCETLHDRFAILDPRIGDESPTQVLNWRRQFETRYAALYYPWLRVPDPLELDSVLRLVPPSGHVAGVYARGDLRVGVHRPPANVEVESALDVATRVNDAQHGDLNDQGVNVIRPYNGRGIRVAGARTLSSDPLARYVNVRRLLIMLVEAFESQTQWATFEPNNPDLWREADRAARSLLDDLWRRGALDGATAEAAYSVRCDAATNPPAETEAGRMICEIGVQPPWPAEFVIVKIGRTESGTELIEATEAAHG